MKPLEEAFASNIFRQVVLPGIVLSIGLHPLISRFVPTLEQLYGFGSTILIVAEIIVLGLCISSAIQSIYYVYEGFRLGWLTALAGYVNRWRVPRQQELALNIQGDRDFNDLTPKEQSQITKIYEYLQDFPLLSRKDGSREYSAERPTRLGNIIATYELYAESRYGVDGIDFWYHFLNLASDASRRAFEEKYAFAESMVLASFSGALVAALHTLVLIGFGIGRLSPSLVVVHLSTGPALSMWLTVFGVLIWLLFYMASIPAHREAGATLRAIIDTVFPKFVDWAGTMQFSEGTIKKIAELGEYLKRPNS